MSLQLARQLTDRLSQLQRRIVFAESCTGGLISAELAKVPGVSDWLCGSAVTYRCDTKVQWLGVREQDIESHSAVSREVASQMAQGVLAKTPEACISASITGHLGPGAPDGFDGIVYIGIAARTDSDIATVDVSRHQLDQKDRESRQAEAAELVIKSVLIELC